MTILSGGSPYDDAVIAELERELGIEVRAETMDFDAYFARLDVSAEWSTLCVMLQHRTEIRNAASRESLNWTSTDGVDANVTWTKILSEVSCARFERCFRNTHHVITRDDFFRAVIGH